MTNFRVADNPDSERSAQCSVASGWGPGVSAPFDISHRRMTEEAFVFAGKLTTALISDFECSPCGIDSLDEHFPARAHQTKLFLILQWA